MTSPLDWLKQQNKQSGANLDESIDGYEQLADQAGQALKEGQARTRCIRQALQGKQSAKQDGKS